MVMNEILSNNPVQSVGDIARKIKGVLEDNFEYVKVRGEVSGLSRPASGHIYLKLKDNDAVLDATIWKSKALYLPFKPEEGMEVIASGKITSYGARSNYQLNIESLEMAGQGALLKLLEERKKKLQGEGLFSAERKRPLPFMPRTIGVITSPTGAVIRDIIHRIRERFPCHIILWGVSVQGESAKDEITRAIIGFNRPNPHFAKPDLLIIARGGGSIEDLWAFNEESVVRACAESAIPTISAVGHETDVTLIDYASDKRAPTPTAAAEMAVPVLTDHFQWLDDRTDSLHHNVRQNIHNKQNQLHNMRYPNLANILTIKANNTNQIFTKLQQYCQNTIYKQQQIVHKYQIPNPAHHITNMQERVQKLHEKMDYMAQNTLNHHRQKLEFIDKILHNLSYKNTLKRGFAIIQGENGAVLTNAQQWGEQKRRTITFADESKVHIEQP